MTREEAIKILKAIRVYECYPKSASEETKEAIDMAIEALSAEAVHKPDYSYEADMVRRLKEALSAEAVQGKWIDYVGKDLGIEGQWLRDDGKTVFAQCDQCDSMFVRNLMTHMNYCPNCGARMKGADDED